MPTRSGSRRSGCRRSRRGSRRDLALGRHAAVVGELEGLSTEHPLREHLLGLLMLALYRCGRQADALEAYRTGRRRLHDELGIEPTPELRQLEQQILRHDPELAAPPARRRRRPGCGRARQRRVLALVVVVLAAAAAAVWLAVGRGSSASPGRRAADTAVLVDANGKLGTAIPVGASPATRRHWRRLPLDEQRARRHGLPGRRRRPDGRDDPGRAEPRGARLRRRARLGRQRRRRECLGDRPARRQGRAHAPRRQRPARPGRDAAATLWVANSVDGTLARCRHAFGSRDAPSRSARGPIAVAAGPDAVWVALAGSGAVAKLDRDGRPRRRDDQRRQRSRRARARRTTTSGSRTRRTGRSRGSTRRAASSTRPSQLGGSPRRARGGGRHGLGDARRRTRRARRRELGAAASGPSASAASRRRSSPDGTSAWVSTLPPPASHRGGTLRVFGERRRLVPLRRPGRSRRRRPLQPLDLVYDGLVAYRRVGGPAGSALVPGPRTGDPAPERRWTHLRLPAPPRRPLLERAPRPAERRPRVVRPPLPHQPARALPGLLTGRRPLLRGPRRATSRGTSSPTTAPAPSPSTSRRPTPSFSTSSRSRSPSSSLRTARRGWRGGRSPARARTASPSSLPGPAPRPRAQPALPRLRARRRPGRIPRPHRGRRSACRAAKQLAAVERGTADVATPTGPLPPRCAGSSCATRRSSHADPLGAV